MVDALILKSLVATICHITRIRSRLLLKFEPTNCQGLSKIIKVIKPGESFYSNSQKKCNTIEDMYKMGSLGQGCICFLDQITVMKPAALYDLLCWFHHHAQTNTKRKIKITPR